LTQAGDIVAVATPGHTANHISILVQEDILDQEDATTFVLAGDASYNEALMLGSKADGVSSNEGISRATLEAIKIFARSRPTVYLPTHDPKSGNRLANRCRVGTPGPVASQEA
jgi:glyoxylase-like metal-dependent hydrolase (beta-lactamase superfamily II)